MRVERAVLREIPLRLKEFFEISSGGIQDRRILLLTLYGEGLEGWSECVAEREPAYAYETTDTAWHLLTDFILPNVVGREVERPEDILTPVSWIRGHGMAKAAVEMAAWDMAARADGVSLSEKLGGTRSSVAVGVSVGIKATDEELHEQVAGFLDDGYARVKIKIKPGRDVEMLAGLRERFPDVSFMADANSAYRLADAPRLKELDDLDLMMIEQPLFYDDFLEHAKLQEQIETPICLDESIKSEGDTALALEPRWAGGSYVTGTRRAGATSWRLSPSAGAASVLVDHRVPLGIGGAMNDIVHFNAFNVDAPGVVGTSENAVPSGYMMLATQDLRAVSLSNRPPIIVGSGVRGS